MLNRQSVGVSDMAPQAIDGETAILQIAQKSA
jgi:hypothetical protein